CNANVYGTGVCNVIVVQRVVNASLGGVCLTGTGTVSHTVALNWQASTSENVAGYRIYRGTTSGGPYALVSSVGLVTSFADSNVQSGQTYYYVTTALSTTGTESVYSNQTQAVIPIP